MSRQFEDPLDQRAYRELRKKGMKSDEAFRAVELMTGHKPVNISAGPVTDMWGYSYKGNDQKAELPYYHGNRRF